MNMFQHIAKTATLGAVTVLFAASFAAAEQGGRYWVPTTTNPDTDQPRVAVNRAVTPKGRHTKKGTIPSVRPTLGLRPKRIN